MKPPSNNPNSSSGPVEFPPTLWTEVVEPATEDSPRAQAALRRLSEIYYDAIRAFFRLKCAQRGPHDPRRPDELAGGFVARLLEKKRLGAVLRKGDIPFRCWLIDRLTKHFISVLRWENAKKRGGGQSLDSLDKLAEDDGFDPPGSQAEGVHEVDLQFALTHHRAALARLDEKHAKGAHARRFALLRPHLRKETDPETLAQIAATLGEKKNTVQVALIRLRDEYHDAFRAQVAQTIRQCGAELDEETRYLSGLVLLALEAGSGRD